jgi:hypothetical protein
MRHEVPHLVVRRVDPTGKGHCAVRDAFAHTIEGRIFFTPTGTSTTRPLHAHDVTLTRHPRVTVVGRA